MLQPIRAFLFLIIDLRSVEQSLLGYISYVYTYIREEGFCDSDVHLWFYT